MLIHSCSFHVSPATRKGKRLQLLQMLLLPFIPIMALVMQNVLTVSSYFVFRLEQETLSLKTLWVDEGCHYCTEGSHRHRTPGKQSNVPSFLTFTFTRKNETETGLPLMRLTSCPEISLFSRLPIKTESPRWVNRLLCWNRSGSSNLIRCIHSLVHIEDT